MKTMPWMPMILCIAISLGIVALWLERTPAMPEENRVNAETKQPENKIYTIENCIREFSDDKVEKTPQGWQFWFVPADLSPNFNFKMTQVGPQAANHPAHSHPEEEIYYIFEGKAEFTLNGRIKTVGPNSTMFCPSGMPHGIRNVGDSPLRYAVIKGNYPKER